MYDEWQAEYEAMMDAKAKAEYEEYCYYEAKKDYLVQLLNEYEISLDSQPYWTRNRVSISEEMVISKRYWFIKWLVQNDKIDFDKCWLDVRHYLSYNKRYDKWIVMAENYDNDTFVVREFYSPYEQLLMLLAISDNPIDLLCEIIKN